MIGLNFFKKIASNLAEKATKNMPLPARVVAKVTSILTGIITAVQLIMAVVGVLIVLTAVDWVIEMFSAKSNTEAIYEAMRKSMKFEEMSDLIEVKQNSEGEYYLDFRANIDIILEQYINKMNKQAGYHKVPKDVEFFKKIIKAEVCMKFPDLGGEVPDKGDGFQGVVKVRRVTPDKEIGKMENTGEGETTVIEEETIDDIVVINEYESFVKQWEKNKELETISKAIVYKERESKLHPGQGTGYFDVQYKKDSEKKLMIPKGSKVTYTGNYKNSVNSLTNEVTTYVEVTYEDIKGYVVAQNLININGEEEEEETVEEISKVKNTRTTSRAKGLIMGKEGKDYIIAIAAGHNNTDNTGAVSPSGDLVEQDLTVKVAEKVEELLKDYTNVKVVQTGSTSDNRGGVKLSDRRELARAANPDLCIQVHFNSGGGTGSEVIYKENDGISQELAQILSKTISSSMGLENRGDGSDTEKSGKSLTIIENSASSGFPAVVTEGAFLDGDPDADIIRNQNGVLKYAQGIVDGIKEYFESDHKGHSSSNKEHETVTSSIRSRVNNLKYVPLEQFRKLVEENDTKALQLLTLDEEKKLITATWHVDEEGNIIIEENPPVDLTTTLQQYIVPFEYLLFFYIDSDYEAFSEDLAEVILKSEIVMAVQDSITTTKKVIVTQTKTEASDGRFYKDWSNVGSNTIITEEVSTSTNVTYVDTWCVKTYNDNNYSTKALEMGNKDKVTINITGTVNESTSTGLSDSRVTGSGQGATGEVDAAGNLIMYTYTNYARESTTTDIIENEYDAGENHTKGVENKFINLYHKHNMIGKVRTSGYIFSIIEQNEKTANLLNLTKYLIYKASEMEYDVLEFSFDEFELEEFKTSDSSSGSTSVYATGNALLEYLKAWEGHEGLSPDGKKYKIGLVNGNRTVGYGIDLETSGFEPRFKLAKYSTNVGDYVDVYFVDNLTKEEIQQKRDMVISKTSKCKPPLNEEQIDALAVVAYQYGNIGNFVEMYAKYGNTEELRNHCQAYKSGGGLNANGYYFTTKIGGNPEGNGRCDANWKLFNKGKYTNQAGEEIKVVSSSGGTIVQSAIKVHEYVRNNGYYYEQAGITLPNTRTKTIDCSSFVTWALVDAKVKGFTEGMAQWTSGTFYNNPKGWKTVKVSEAQPGDILVYSSHVEIVAKESDSSSSKFIVYNCGGNSSIQASGTKDLPESSTSGHTKAQILKILRVTK